MAPWWLRTHKDELIEDSSEGSGEGAPVTTSAPPSPDSDETTDGATSSRRGDSGRGDSEGEETTSPKAPPADAVDDSDRQATGEVKRKRRRRRRRRRSTPGDGKPNTGTAPTLDEGTESTQVISTDAAGTAPTEHTTGSASSSAAPSAAPPTETVVHEARLAGERGYIFSFPERPPGDERKLALLCDFENIALGVKESQFPKLDINLILARLVEKGKIIVKKAYADWERYSEYKRPLHEAAIELIDIPQKYYSGKNSADIKLVVDAMDLCYSKEHLDTFVILSGDSDFSPLVSKLKENDKVVIGIGVKNSSSNLLVENCDEFIFYEDIWRAAEKRPTLDHLPAVKAEVFGLMADAMLALLRENKEILWGSLVKQTMQRKRPSFTEEYFGYGSFSELLEDAARHKIIGLRKDQRSGNYVVTGFVNQ